MIERAVRLAQATSGTTAIALLVLFNLVPLVGVVFGGWSVATILVLYWVENGIVGALNVPKILLAAGSDGASLATTSRPLIAVGRLGQVGFFLVHYGLFWFVHGIFVWTLPFMAGPLALDSVNPVFPGAFPDVGAPVFDGVVRAPRGPDLSAVTWGAAGLAISHVASFVINVLGRREYAKVTPARQMFAPYGRLVILHVTIIIGAMVSLILGSPVGAVVVLVVLKTVVDLAFHLREHGRLAGQPPPSIGADRPIQPV